MKPARRASEVSDFPFLAKSACIIEKMKEEVGLTFTNGSKTDLRAAVARAENGESILYAVWPGQWSSHLFLIDDLDQLKAAL